MSLDSIRHHAGPVLEVFRSNNRSDQVLALETLLSGLDWPDNRTAVLEEIVRRCDIRAWGDLYVEDMSWQDWLDLLGNLKDAAEAELGRIEASASQVVEPEDIAGALRRRIREVRSTAAAAHAAAGTGSRETFGSRLARLWNAIPKQFVRPAIYFLICVAVVAVVVALFGFPRTTAPRTLEVSGGLKRTEPVAVGLPSDRTRMRLFLDGDPVVYSLSNPEGLGWLSVLSRIGTGDRLTLVVGRDSYEEARRVQEKIRRRMRETSDVGQFGQLAAQAIAAGKSHPVTVVEMRRSGAVIYSRNPEMPAQGGVSFFLWISIAIAALAALAGFRFVLRRASPPPEPAE